MNQEQINKQINTNKEKTWGWRDGAVVKNGHCASGRLKLTS